MDEMRTEDGLGGIGRVEGSWGGEVVRWAEAYDPEGRGLPRWRTREEALFPEGWEEGRVTVDAMALLSRELHAVCAGGEASGVEGGKLDFAEGCMRDLDEWLKSSFWDGEGERMMSWKGGEGLRVEEGPGQFFALIWPGTRAELTEQLRPRCEASVKRGAAGGWTVRGWLKFYEALLADGTHKRIVAEMTARGLPGEATDAERAAWERMSREARRRRGRAPGWLCRLEDGEGGRRLGWAAAVCAAAVAAGAAALGVSGGGADGRAGERAANAAVAEGDWGRAAELWGGLAERGGEDADYFRYREAGALMHAGRWAEGLERCESLLERHPDAPNVRMNRGLCLLRLGREAEALGAYRELAEDERGEREWPSVAARAARAVGLLESRK